MAKTKQPDLLEALMHMPSTEGYLPMDKYRDFRKVFTTDEGKRVLSEIMSWGRLTHATLLGRPIDPYAMAVAFGERNMALKLLATVLNEPIEKPQQARKRA